MFVESVGLVVHGCFYCRWMVDWAGRLVGCPFLFLFIGFGCFLHLGCVGYLLILIVQTDKENYIDFRLRLLGEPGDPHNDYMWSHMSCEHIRTLSL